MKKIKLGYGFNETKGVPEIFFEVSLLLEDIIRNEDKHIEWVNSKEKITGTNISDIEKLPNNMIAISFPILCDDDIDPNPYIISKDKYIKFLEDWRDFGKSGKKYIYLKEDDDGWYSFEYPEEKNS